MNSLFLKDQTARPELFAWNGPLDEETLSQWINNSGVRANEELFRLWLKTGGGYMFESELILAPFGDPRMGEDVVSVNDIHRGEGLSHELLLVHIGSVLTALRIADGAWVVVEPSSYRIVAAYSSFDEWYERVIRSEFAERYGLLS